ncbi:DUF1674 domain-containing protein [Cognatiluteimonas lumbrici]|uniref:DUF1674 domain-containing protein n=1 Tax=Cognatiluteimonas lumbrici TaxID=2559601 RepID=UPI00112EEB10|nr:DUF1674 domain-containing protein [Luteimonas lumbrici]
MIGETVLPPEPGEAGAEAGTPATDAVPAQEIGGREGPDPTRYGDWEKNGRCIDF